MGDRLAILNDGELQQYGEPTEVYNNPVNEFVGGFIGSPSMNFFDVDVRSVNGTTTLIDESVGFEFPLSGAYIDRNAADLQGQTYTLGIRPENIELQRQATDAVASAEVTVVEPIGSDNYVHLDLGPEFVARVDPNNEPTVGETVGISFSEDDIHLFHPETGEDVFLTQREIEKATV